MEQQEAPGVFRRAACRPVEIHLDSVPERSFVVIVAALLDAEDLQHLRLGASVGLSQGQIDDM